MAFDKAKDPFALNKIQYFAKVLIPLELFPILPLYNPKPLFMLLSETVTKKLENKCLHNEHLQ